MKKRILSFIVLLVGISLLFACTEKDEIKQKYTVSFLCDGKIILSYEVEEGEPITVLPELEDIPGYEWKIEDYPDKVTRNLKLQITRFPLTYSVKFDYNGATSNLPEEYFFKYDTVMSGLPKPEKDGYKFISFRCGDKSYVEGSVYDIVGDSTFTAEWEPLFRYEPEGDGIRLTEYIGEKTVDGLTVPSEMDGKKVVRIEKGLIKGVVVQRLSIPFLGEFNGDNTGCLGYLYGLNYTEHSMLNTRLKAVSVGEINEIPPDAFNGCAALTTVNLSDSVEAIGERAFYNCSTLANINLSKVKDIGANAFYGCAAVNVLTLTSVEKIGENAFGDCVGLKSATISAWIEEISDRAFYGCTSLRTVSVNAGVPPKIGESVFYFNDGETEKIISGLAIRVPATKTADYKGAEGWKEYSGVIVPMSSSGGGAGGVIE